MNLWIATSFHLGARVRRQAHPRETGRSSNRRNTRLRRPRYGATDGGAPRRQGDSAPERFWWRNSGTGAAANLRTLLPPGRRPHDRRRRCVTRACQCQAHPRPAPQRDQRRERAIGRYHVLVRAAAGTFRAHGAADPALILKTADGVWKRWRPFDRACPEQCRRAQGERLAESHTHRVTPRNSARAEPFDIAQDRLLRHLSLIHISEPTRPY